MYPYRKFAAVVFQIFCTIAAVLPVIVATGAHLSAQETLTSASIMGRVLDTTGAALARAEVVAVAIATNQKYAINVDQQGRFRIPFLPVGEYTITAQANGFNTATQYGFGYRMHTCLPRWTTSIARRN